MSDFWDASHFRQMHGLSQSSVGNRAFNLKIHHINICATFIYMHISVRYFFCKTHYFHFKFRHRWQMSEKCLTLDKCTAFPTSLWDKGPFFCENPPYIYMYNIYTYICTYIYMVALAKLTFLTSNSGRNDRFLRCVSLSAHARPSPELPGRFGL